MSSKSVELVLENIKKSLPNGSNVDIPEDASVLEQLQILQCALVKDEKYRKYQREETRRSVRESWYENDARRATTRYTGILLLSISSDLNVKRNI